MKIVSVFMVGEDQAIKLPKNLGFEGVEEVFIEKKGEALVLKPKRKSWLSLLEHPKADDDFLTERGDVF